jgi:cytochrome b involved in lipid metabolism
MQNKWLTIMGGVILIVGMGFLVYATKKQAYIPVDNNGGAVVDKVVNTEKAQTPASSQPVSKPNIKETIPKVASGITIADIAMHSTRESCWSAMNGSVYDLTSWIPNHPGGERAILSICGIDGSNKYNGQHGGDQKKAMILFGFKIGALAK